MATTLSNLAPPPIATEAITDAAAAVARLDEIYERNTGFLRDRFTAFANGEAFTTRVRATYPFVRVTTSSHTRLDSRLAYGFVAGPGVHETTVTRPDLFRAYLTEQIGLLIENHGVAVEVGQSSDPIPVHFAYRRDINIDWMHSGSEQPVVDRPLRDVFDTPDLAAMDDAIAGHPHCDAFIEPGNVIMHNKRLGGGTSGTALKRLPQMPAYHLAEPGRRGITLINIGTGPSNARTMTDHVAVLRPHAWLMLGHCAGLRTTQKLGDYVLAHGYVREDHVLDQELPLWVPIPALAEMQVALEQSVGEVTGLSGFELKHVMRTGTVASVDNRNWEIGDPAIIRRLSQSRAIALDMELAAIAANGFRFRVPYGTLLCVSDKPIHGEIKLAGMAGEFYRQRVGQHLEIGLRALEKLKSQEWERLHSRKLRSFAETAFR